MCVNELVTYTDCLEELGWNFSDPLVRLLMATADGGGRDGGLAGVQPASGWACTRRAPSSLETWAPGGTPCMCSKGPHSTSQHYLASCNQPIYIHTQPYRHTHILLAPAHTHTFQSFLHTMAAECGYQQWLWTRLHTCIHRPRDCANGSHAQYSQEATQQELGTSV